MLGHALQRVLRNSGFDVEAFDKHGLDITDAAAVQRVVHDFALQGAGAVINAAAYTDVEGAEDDAEAAYLVNAAGPRVLAEAARDAGLPFVHVSTDFVFDGTKDGPYTEDDEPRPLSVYGASKLAGERAVSECYPEALIVRTAWVYGPNGRSFPAKILEFARTRKCLKVVADEYGSPTYTMDLAEGIRRLIDADARGLYHLAGSGRCSRYTLAEETLALAGVQCELVPVRAVEFLSKAQRPRNSALDCSKAAALGVVLPDWRDGLARFITGRHWRRTV